MTHKHGKYVVYWFDAPHTKWGIRFVEKHIFDFSTWKYLESQQLVFDNYFLAWGRKERLNQGIDTA